MKKANNKNLIKIIILIIVIILLILIGFLICKQAIENKFKKMLEDNDSTNYELVQTDGQSQTTIKALEKVYTLEDETNLVWISEEENTRVVMDKENKLAMITENSEDKFEIGRLNSQYIKNYFENKSMKFKYLGTEDNFYKIQFEDKNSAKATIFYINKDTKIIEKMVEKFNGAENTYNIKVTINCVNELDVDYPDLTGYNIGTSASSMVSGE